ncbi:MAG TPA: dihydroneopterin aldolase [Candidatus Dormibacteraeota bacterium]
MDRIQLEGMVFSGRHGVRPAERAEPQEFKVDVKVDADLSEAERSDKVEDTVDYRPIHAIAKSVIEGESTKLIETLAGRIAERVLDLDRVVGVSVRVTKRPQSMRPLDGASVEIRRSRA